jgi:hypothetical protein
MFVTHVFFCAFVACFVSGSPMLSLVASFPTREPILQVFPVAAPAVPCPPSVCSTFVEQQWSVLVRTATTIHWLFAKVNTTSPSSPDALQLVRSIDLSCCFVGRGFFENIQNAVETRLVNPNVSCIDSCEPIFFQMNGACSFCIVNIVSDLLVGGIVTFITQGAVFFASDSLGANRAWQNTFCNNLSGEDLSEFVDYERGISVFVTPQSITDPLHSLFQARDCGTLLQNNRGAATVEGVAPSYPLLFRTPTNKSESAFFLFANQLQQTSFLVQKIAGVSEFKCGAVAPVLIWVQNYNDKGYRVVMDLETVDHRFCLLSCLLLFDNSLKERTRLLLRARFKAFSHWLFLLFRRMDPKKC